MLYKLSFFLTVFFFLSCSLLIGATAQARDNTITINNQLNSASKKYLGHFYVNKMFLNVMQVPQKTSASLGTLECGQEVRVFEHELTISNGWFYVEVTSKLQGFIEKRYLANNRPECFQKKYPKFYNSFPLDNADRYYWGQIFSRTLNDETKVGL